MTDDTVAGSAPISPIRIGPLVVEAPVFLAPMSGVSDLPFRSLAQRFGAGAVVTEMVASKELVNRRVDVCRRLAFAGPEAERSNPTQPDKASRSPRIVQLAGYAANWMAEGAKIAVDEGAEVIDINMGCPAREVTGKQSGSALMRDLDHASALIEATCNAVSVPVAVKMRLGWDWRSLNAADLARRAEALGVTMITVHGRTRCQFFKDAADWKRVRDVVEAVDIPVVVNGDITSPDAARSALKQSGAHGVMIGRGAYGAPWLIGRTVAALKMGRDSGDPPVEVQAAVAREHVMMMMEHYGPFLGLRNARKHIGWYVERAGARGAALKIWRKRLCTGTDATAVLRDLAEFYQVACSGAFTPAAVEGRAA